MTCDYCFDGKHWKCHDPKCGCNVCASGRAKTPPKREASPSRSAVGTIGHSENLRVYSKPLPKKRDRTGERARYYQSRLPAEQRQLRQKIGRLTRFSAEQVERIFQAKSEGITISELAREFDTTRDKIRTVYNSPTAPPLGVRPKPPKPPKPTCPTCGQTVKVKRVQ